VEALTLYRTYPRPWGTTLNPLDLGVGAQVGLAMVLCPLGHLDEALSQSREAIDFAEALRPEMGAFSLASAHSSAARIRLFRREPERAAWHARRAIELGTEHGYPLAVATGHLDLATAQVALGEHALGARDLAHALAKWRADGFELDRPYWLGALAEAQAAQGELDEALATIASAIDHGREHGGLLYDAELHRLRGALALRRWPDEPERAADDFAHALFVARQQQARLFELRAAVSLHRLRLAQGRGGESRLALEAVLSSCQEGLDTPDLLEARALMDAKSTA
jgi:predicted ATPase